MREVSPWAVRGLYVVAAILAVPPVVEYLVLIWPMRPTDLGWRYGAIGLGAVHLPNMTVGLAGLMAMAFWQRHDRFLRGAALVCFLIAALILSFMAIFALDLLAVRALRPQEQRGSVLSTGAIQELKYLLTGLALASLGAGGWRMSRGDGSEGEASPGIIKAGNR